jgi:hypothetical protein
MRRSLGRVAAASLLGGHSPHLLLAQQRQFKLRSYGLSPGRDTIAEWSLRNEQKSTANRECHA